MAYSGGALVPRCPVELMTLSVLGVATPNGVVALWCGQVRRDRTAHSGGAWSPGVLSSR